MIVNTKLIYDRALKGHYSIPHFNIIDANYVKNVILEAEKLKTPVIIASSANSVKYIGGFKTFADLVKNIDSEFKIKTEVVIHLDHGNYNDCVKALKSGFTSVMFDGSSLSIKENCIKTQEIVNIANKTNASVEAEIGGIGGEEDGIIGFGALASIEDANKIKSSGISSLAAGINNIHGAYPKDWKGLNIKRLKEIRTITNLPLVLHGGSGIPLNQIQDSIKNGIAKINVGTVLQTSFGNGVKEYINKEPYLKDKKWYDPRKIIDSGIENVIKVVRDHAQKFGSIGKSNDNK